jgi:hypothetical protein
MLARHFQKRLGQNAADPDLYEVLHLERLDTSAILALRGTSVMNDWPPHSSGMARPA